MKVAESEDYHLFICSVSALRSTIGVLTIRPIKEIFQWHFGGAAYCLSKQGFGGDTCTFFARSSQQQHEDSRQAPRQATGR